MHSVWYEVTLGRTIIGTGALLLNGAHQVNSCITPLNNRMTASFVKLRTKNTTKYVSLVNVTETMLASSI